MSIKSMSGLPGGLTAQAPSVMTVISCPPCTSLTHSPWAPENGPGHQSAAFMERHNSRRKEREEEALSATS